MRDGGKYRGKDNAIIIWDGKVIQCRAETKSWCEVGLKVERIEEC